MTAPETNSTVNPRPASRWPLVLVVCALITAALGAYYASFANAFVYDDLPAIVDNPSLRHLGTSLQPLQKSGLPVGGRPLVNFSLALNYAFGGLDPTGYRGVNVVIHIAAGLVLLGLVRRTLRLPLLRERYGAASLPVAAVVALLWILHPLQTESVTYVVQRAESLMGLCYLLTVYCFLRGAEARQVVALSSKSGGAAWFVCAWMACFLGMTAKEVMVSAPLLVFLYDRTFLAGTFRDAWHRRKKVYGGLASTWLVLVYLALSSGDRGGTAGFDTTVPWWAYALTQGPAIVRYLGLSVWPHPLVFDYGTDVLTDLSPAWPGGLAVAVLLAGTFFSLKRWPAIGFLGAWFFAILAPTSSVLPISTEIMAEHRMYLPLAAVITLVVFGLYRWIGLRGLAIAGLVLAVGFGMATARRNDDYRSERTLWSDTVAKRPDNPRARFNLGVALAQDGAVDEAIREYQEAVRLRSDFASAHSNLSSALLQRGRTVEAAVHAGAALRIRPDFAEAHTSLANALYLQGKVMEALPHYAEAVRLLPDNAQMRSNWGTALMQLGRMPEAVGQYREALRLNPGYADAHFYLGNAYARLGRFDEAAEQYEAALRLQPNFTRARDNLDRIQPMRGRRSP